MHWSLFLTRRGAVLVRVLAVVDSVGTAVGKSWSCSTQDISKTISNARALYDMFSCDSAVGRAGKWADVLRHYSGGSVVTGCNQVEAAEQGHVHKVPQTGTGCRVRIRFHLRPVTSHHTDRHAEAEHVRLPGSLQNALTGLGLAHIGIAEVLGCRLQLGECSVAVLVDLHQV